MRDGRHHRHLWPTHVFQAAENLNKLLGAVPESLWWLFGAGYLATPGAQLRQVAWAGLVTGAAEHDNPETTIPDLTAFTGGGVWGFYVQWCPRLRGVEQFSLNSCQP